MKTEPYYTVRNSKIHGRGVFARRPIRKGTKVIEYTGKIVSADKAEKIGSAGIDGHGHTMLFSIDKDRVINGNVGGPAKYINHSCEPNCETVRYDERIFIEALRSVKKGEEITYDYHLEVPGKITKKIRKEFACFCGSPNCRGSQIAAELLKKQAKLDEQKKRKKEQKEAKKAELKALKKQKKANKKAAKKEKKKARKGKKTEAVA